MLLRTVKDLDAGEVCSKLLVAGELSGACQACSEIGIDIRNAKKCPKCAVLFQYISLRSNTPVPLPSILRLMKKRPDLMYVEYSDLKGILDRDKAKGIFKNDEE